MKFHDAVKLADNLSKNLDLSNTIDTVIVYRGEHGLLSNGNNLSVKNLIKDDFYICILHKERDFDWIHKTIDILQSSFKDCYYNSMADDALRFELTRNCLTQYSTYGAGLFIYVQEEPYGNRT